MKYCFHDFAAFAGRRFVAPSGIDILPCIQNREPAMRTMKPRNTTGLPGSFTIWIPGILHAVLSPAQAGYDRNKARSIEKGCSLRLFPLRHLSPPRDSVSVDGHPFYNRVLVRHELELVRKVRTLFAGSPPCPSCRWPVSP